MQREQIGYQWKNLFLPDGAELRLRYRGVYYYASIKRDQLVYGGEAVSPRGWALMVTGTVRNPWRDIWIRRTYHEVWTQAAKWRPPQVKKYLNATADRRQRARRCSD